LAGKLVWKFSAGDKIFSDPFVWKDRVFFGSRNGNAYCLEKSNGKSVWTFRTAGHVSCSPLVHEGTVYIGSADKNLYAIDAMTGRLKWKFSTAGPVRFNLVAWEGRIFFGSMDGVMRAVDRDGNLLWKYPVGFPISTLRPTISNGVVFFGARDQCFYAVEMSSGRLVWKYKSRGYPNDIFAYNGVLYIGICENDLFMVDEKTGRELWTFPTNGWVLKFTEHNGRILFSSWDCHVYCITPDGKLLWKFSTSLGNQASIDLDQEGKGGESFEVTWTPEEETEERKEEKRELSDYSGGIKSEYASAGMGDYLGKKKRGYV
jgi:outer membrane protein assembly factor BamB